MKIRYAAGVGLLVSSALVATSVAASASSPRTHDEIKHMTVLKAR
jgi:hypothetical protein